MKVYASPEEIFIRYDQRSIDLYYPQLSDYVRQHFAPGDYQDEDTVKKIIGAYYDWCARQFQQIISAINDLQFVYYLFSFHESSILLWRRVIQQEDLEAKFEIQEEELALNRRIFKLALEQTCDVDYTRSSAPSKALFKQYDAVIEDLLYIGKELYNASNFLAELRMIPNSYYAIIEPAGGYLHIRRKGENETIMNTLYPIINADFAEGIMDDTGAQQLKTKILECFGVNYDFAAGQILYIQKQLNPVNWEYQTIERGILIQNLVNNGASQQNAESFYHGLTLTRENKQTIQDSIYKVNSMERYFFRPILELSWKGERRHLIGMQKWAESITVLATNNFQWDKAPAEWKQNAGFQEYLELKSNEHDALLEVEVEKVLVKNDLPFMRNITFFSDGKNGTSVEIPGVGEMDFVWIDAARNKIVVADCKYNRARYDTISFSSDYASFKNIYEKKIMGKAKWIRENIELVEKHFARLFTGKKIDIGQYEVEELFLINTPTLYMYLNRAKTVCFFKLEDFIFNGYLHPDITLEVQNGIKTSYKVKSYPYFSI